MAQLSANASQLRASLDECRAEANALPLKPATRQAAARHFEQQSARLASLPPTVTDFRSLTTKARQSLQRVGISR